MTHDLEENDDRQSVSPMVKGFAIARTTFFGLAISLVVTGCNKSDTSTASKPASWKTRATRRAYDGAPPVIAHPPQSSKCVACHTPEGSERPPLGIAPANPHTKTAGMSEDSRCRQCHVFAKTNSVFVANDFDGFKPNSPHGPRLNSKAPPTIPHGAFMREDCNACHTGLAARPEIRCSHASRARCVQCHVYQLGHEDFSIAKIEETSTNQASK